MTPLQSRRIFPRVRANLVRTAPLVLAAALAACSDSPSGPKTGTLDVSIAGLPAGAAASVTVTGPAQSHFSQTLIASQALANLAPGTYTLAATNVTSAGAKYTATPASQTIQVAASKTAQPASVTYALSSGALAITVIGTPAGSAPQITVSGPGGYTRLVTTSETLLGLEPGLYSVSAPDLTANGSTYTATTGSAVPIQVPVSLTPATATVTYALASGSIALTVTGLPAGGAGSVTISGPNGYSQQFGTTRLISNLTPGTYTIQTAPFTATDGNVYTATPLAQTTTVLASDTPKAITVTYSLSTGSIAVTITGLPAGVDGRVTVSGPAGFTRDLAATGTIVGVTPGSYTITANTVSAAGTTYAGTPNSQVATVSASLTASQASVAYASSGGPPPPAFNLAVDGLYLTQVVQSYAGAVPLIAGKDAFLRVFVKATTSNATQPSVRVRVYQGATLASTITIPSPTIGVATTVSEATLSSSWNALIPAAFVQPGLAILADVDPTGAVSEANENDNTFPATAQPLPITVQNVAPFLIQFVPVRQSANGLQGNVTDANKDQFLSFAQKVLPIRDVNVAVHLPYTTSTPVLDSNDSNSAWISILGEMNALRVAEGSSSYYFGVVKTSYNSGVAGYGYVPGRAAVGWDFLPSGTQVTAHELGHNMSRFHAPCGGAGAPDQGFPYSGGVIGVYGYDIATGTIKQPTTSDLMGYCGFGWVSDYTFTGMLNYRLNTANASIASAGGSASVAASTQGQAIRRTLVVWGRIEDGRLVLEPAFASDTRVSLPTRPGPYRIEGRDAAGRVLFSHAFDGEEIADVPGRSVKQFAFAVPMPSVAVASLQLSGGGAAARIDAGSSAVQPTIAIDESASGMVSVRLGGVGARLAVVRDRRTGQILSLARPGTTVLRVGGAEIDVEATDGLRVVGRQTFRRVR
jgi:hypothetical protein